MDNTRPLTTVASTSSSPYYSSTTTTINPLPGEDCAVVADEAHATRKRVQQQRNDPARDFAIETEVSMEIVKSYSQNVCTIVRDNTPGTSLQDL